MVRLAFVIAMLLLAIPATTAAPRPVNGDVFDETLDEARAAFRRRAFVESTELLRKAHALKPVPLLLYNIGRSYQEAGMAEEALAAYAEFFLTKPTGEERTLAEQRMREALASKGRPPLPSCGGITCPTLAGYTAQCNARGACELSRVGGDSSWSRHDVWVLVPGGTYVVGSPSVESNSPAERPAHAVSLWSGVLLSRSEITVAWYEACVAAGKCTEASVADWDAEGFGLSTSAGGRADHPQNGLTWQQARDACAFAGGRLPSEAEWEAAASGPTHRKYPWGDGPEPTCANGTAVFDETGTREGYGCGKGGTWPVGSRPEGASALGLVDQAGNVWEWVEDCYHPSLEGAPIDGSAWTTDCGRTKRVIRGGSFYSDTTNDLRSSRRDLHIPTTRRAHLGARCARPLPP